MCRTEVHTTVYTPIHGRFQDSTHDLLPVANALFILLSSIKGTVGRKMSMGRTLGSFEQLVLLAILRVGDGAYGVPVQEEIERVTGRDVAAGALYRALDRLEERGLVSSGLGAPTAERGGRRRRTLAVTPMGARELEDALGAVRGMAEGLDAHIRSLASEA